MEIIIGRDPNNGQLTFTIDDKESQTVSSGILPSSIAQSHCKLIVNQHQMRLMNLDVNNYTYVNGQSIESKAITPNNKIELGSDRYLLNWEDISPLLPADISPLKAVWDCYEDKNIKLQIAERKFNTLRSMTGLITMVAIALSIASGGKSIWYIVLYGVAIVISLVFFVKAYRDASKIPQKRQELNKTFQHDYVCPHCGHFLGNQSYDILAQNTHCPYCKKQFIH